MPCPCEKPRPDWAKSSGPDFRPGNAVIRCKCGATIAAGHLTVTRYRPPSVANLMKWAAGVERELLKRKAGSSTPPPTKKSRKKPAPAPIPLDVQRIPVDTWGVVTTVDGRSFEVRSDGVWRDGVRDNLASAWLERRGLWGEEGVVELGIHVDLIVSLKTD